MVGPFAARPWPDLDNETACSHEYLVNYYIHDGIPPPEVRIVL